MDELDKKIIRCIQTGIPVSHEPFRSISENLQVTEQELVRRIKALLEAGIIRRVGAVLNHRHVGYLANAMVVWSVPEEAIESVGGFMAGQKEISHCYEREGYPSWPYNLYTMIHARTADECETTIRRLAESTGIRDYEILYSTAELKKASYTYFD